MIKIIQHKRPLTLPDNAVAIRHTAWFCLNVPSDLRGSKIEKEKYALVA